MVSFPGSRADRGSYGKVDHYVMSTTPMENQSQSLSRFIASGDHGAFHELVEQYQRMVFLTCQHILNRCPAEVDDAVQETFLKLARSAGSIESNVGAWLHSCARTTALNRLRSMRMRHRREGEIDSSSVAVADPPDQPLESGEELTIVEDVVEELGHDERELVVSYYYLGQTQQQIADRLGLSQVAIQKRLKHVLETLRQRCTKRGLSFSLLLLAFERHATIALPPPLLERLAHLPVPRPQLHPVPRGRRVRPGTGITLIAAALVLGTMSLGLSLRKTPVTAPATVSAPVVPAHPMIVPVAMPPNPFPFTPQLATRAWKLLGLSGAAVTLKHAGHDLAAWHLSTVNLGLVGTATIVTPHLPQDYRVELLVHTRTVLCPFSSAGIEPCLSGRTPLTNPLHEIDLDVNPVFTAGSWRLVSCEVRHRADGSLVETTSVDGRFLRQEILAHAPTALDSLAIRVIDTDCDVAQLTLTPLDPSAGIPVAPSPSAAGVAPIVVY
jgi:RNA polymerase sigma factor (sigma-70 family)